MLTIALLAMVLAPTAVAAFLFIKLQKLGASLGALERERDDLKLRFQGIVDVEEERRRVLGEIAAERARADEEGRAARAEIVAERSRAEAQLRAAREHEQRDLAATRQRELGSLEAERARLQMEIGTIRSDQQMEQQQFQEWGRNAEATKFNLELSLSKLREDLKELDEEANLRSFGFYKPRYDFASSERYQSKLEEIRARQKAMIQDKTAAICHAEWMVNDSRAAGRKQTNRTLKLILRAFNGECDAAIAKVRYNNIHVMEARIRKAHEAINGLVEVQRAEIVWDYLSLKLEELYLVHEYQEKLQEEKEEQRRIREQMREEEVALRELERAMVDAEREEQRYAEALRKATEQAERAVGEKQQKLLWQVEELKRRLEEAHTNKERAIARAQMTRSGHVYIISNVGSFGEDVFKIGMTRRLEPMDRVKELGDASVPFAFDVHAIIYSDDAPALENKLHRLFYHRRVNLINGRKEFFRVQMDEIARAVKENHGDINIVMDAEAVEYRKTLAMLREGATPQPGDVLELPVIGAATAG